MDANYHTPSPSTTVVLRDARGQPVGIVVAPRTGPESGPGGRTVLLIRGEDGRGEH